jgi:hypothetical protein
MRSGAIVLAPRTLCDTGECRLGRSAVFHLLGPHTGLRWNSAKRRKALTLGRQSSVARIADQNRADCLVTARVA